MTTPIPTGRLEQRGGHRRLVLTRRFAAPIADVWASITESERTARWFASWTGDAGPGRTIRYRLTHEDGQPESKNDDPPANVQPGNVEPSAEEQKKPHVGSERIAITDPEKDYQLARALDLLQGLSLVKNGAAPDAN